MNSENIKKICSLIAIVTILSMFIISGVYKFLQTDKYISMLQEKIGGSKQLNKFLIICAALLQILGSLLIITIHTLSLFGQTHSNLKIFSTLAVIALTLFTLLATYLFKTLSKENPWPFLSNISVAGGLLSICFMNI